MHNVTKQWKTSLLGVLVVLAALVSVFTIDTMSWWDASIGIGIGLALLFAPDTVVNKAALLFTKSRSIEQAHEILEEPPFEELHLDAEKPALSGDSLSPAGDPAATVRKRKPKKRKPKAKGDGSNQEGVHTGS